MKKYEKIERERERELGNEEQETELANVSERALQFFFAGKMRARERIANTERVFLTSERESQNL